MRLCVRAERYEDALCLYSLNLVEFDFLRSFVRFLDNLFLLFFRDKR